MSPAIVSGAIDMNATSAPIAIGSSIRTQRITLSWLLPGRAHRRRSSRERIAASDMGEDVDLGPARQVELRARGQEIEAGLGQLHPPLALQPPVELLPQAVQIADIGRGIVLLRVGQHRAAPVRALLLLRDFL